MVLNYIWIAFFLIAFVVALGKLIFAGDTAVFTEIINSSFTSAKTGFEISLGLTGILSLWLGIMKIGEKGGSHPVVCPVGGTGFQQALPGHTERASGDRFYLYEYLRQPAGTGQRCHTDRVENHAAVAGFEYRKRFGQQFDDHVPLYQCIGIDAYSGQHHDVSGTNGGG